MLEQNIFRTRIGVVDQLAHFGVDLLGRRFAVIARAGDVAAAATDDEATVLRAAGWAEALVLLAGAPDTEEIGAVLFVDEAEALFGRRTDVRDAHDRYANIDAGVVLDRLTRRTGLVIIALAGAVGAELERRADVHVHFPPD